MTILSIILPLILVVLLGFFCTKTQWLNKSQLDALSKFTFSLCFPAFLFYQMAKADFSDQISPSLFIAFYGPVLFCFSLAWFISYFFYTKTSLTSNKKHNTPQSAGAAVFALGASYSNNIIVGLPILLAAMGEQVLGIIFLIVTFHSALLFILTSVIESKASAYHNREHFHPLSFIKKTLNNPLIISILSGLLINLTGISLPIFLQESLALFSKPAITLALFILGASLTFYRVQNALLFISIAAIIKLLLLPCLVLLTSQYIFHLDPFIVSVLVVLSACPTGVNSYLIAVNHQQHQETVAGSIVVSTLLSVITLPLWLSLFIIH